MIYHVLYSPSQLVHTHYLLFFTAFGLQVTKTALLMMVSLVPSCLAFSHHLIWCPQLSGMARTPYPLLHPIMAGPILLCFNIHFPLLPDLLLLSGVAVRPTFLCADNASPNDLQPPPCFPASLLPSLPPSLPLFSLQMFAVLDVGQTCLMSISQIRHSLDVPLFTVPCNQSVAKVTLQPAESSPQNTCSHNE